MIDIRTYTSTSAITPWAADIIDAIRRWRGE